MTFTCPVCKREYNNSAWCAKHMAKYAKKDQIVLHQDGKLVYRRIKNIDTFFPFKVMKND